MGRMTETRQGASPPEAFLAARVAQAPITPDGPPIPVPPVPVPPPGPDIPPAPIEDPTGPDTPLPGDPATPPAGDPPTDPPVRMAPALLGREVGGPAGPEPTRYGDWERKGRVSDF